MNKFKTYIYILLILIPLVIVFMPLFRSFHLVWGDAPFYYPEALKELISKPQVWTEKGIPFGGINLSLWLSPLMILYGLLNKLFNLNNDFITRIVFYFPSIVLSIAGVCFLTKYLKFSRITQFFSILIYTFNTYFLLLIDGGQVGVALAYGLFPIVILFWLRYFDKLNINSFYLALLGSFILCLVDPRITIILYLYLLLWLTFNSKKISGLMLSIVLLVPLNMFWLLPLIKSGSAGLNLEVSNLQLSSILNPLLFFAPHWPANTFGKVISPYAYFALLPILIFGGFLSKKIDKKYYFYAFSFLFFAFLAKGTTPPLGELYQYLITNIPIGSVFRDSSKFFIPLTLLGGILIGSTIEKFFNKKLILFVCYLYILLLISPAIFGKLNFNLSYRQEDKDYQTIYEHLRNEGGQFRTLWFTEKPQLAYETIDKPALGANQLVAFSLFSSINNSEDVYNFLNNPDYVNRLRLLGIRYLFLSGDPRNILPTETDFKNWNEVTKLINNTKGLTKIDWGIDIPIYEIANPSPFIYYTDKLLVKLGPDINQTPEPTLYLEDGKLDLNLLQTVDPASLKLSINNKLDLTFVFLQNDFKKVADFENSNWAVYDSNQYLKAKYELLIRDYKYNDFDYGKGLAFSSQNGEKLIYKFEIPRTANYVIAKRVGNLDKQKLYWEIQEKILEKGFFEHEIENKSNLLVLNTVAVIPESEFNIATKKAEEFINKFNSINPPTSSHKWLIFSQNFDKGLTVKDSGVHLPIYSMINGFYVDNDNFNQSIIYENQKYVDLGIYITLGTILVLVVSYFGYAIYQKRH